MSLCAPVDYTTNQSASRLLSGCPLCQSARLHYAFSRGDDRVVRCADCRLMLLNPPPSSGGTLTSRDDIIARDELDPTLSRYCQTTREALRVLQLSCDGHTRADDWQTDGSPVATFDVCDLGNLLEHESDPLRVLSAVRGFLKPDGVLCISMRPMMRELVLHHSTRVSPAINFDRLTIQNALFLGGFGRVLLAPGADGTTTVFARPAPLLARRRLSIIIPAFNEVATFEQLLRAVLNKRLPDLDIEVVIVESNSTDGTHQIAMRYADHPSVRLILEDRPQGKGHAVRTGLAAATGDFILIQDADLEYDLEDYDVLLDPLVKGREALVLGSRHGGHAWWKMRTFADQPLLSFVFNCGHWFFTTALNRLFGQRLKDPFTMFKVFRRDCLYGLEFKCDRFDFDYELLIKMIRKGYRPIEIPVNYRSRSYGEGKKVSAFRDPFNWIKALIWLRFTNIDPLTVIERQNRAQRDSDEPKSGQFIGKAA